MGSGLYTHTHFFFSVCIHIYVCLKLLYIINTCIYRLYFAAWPMTIKPIRSKLFFVCLFVFNSVYHEFGLDSVGKFSWWFNLSLLIHLQPATQIMASGPITSWEIDGEIMETVSGFIFLDSKITADGDCSHEIYLFLIFYYYYYFFICSGFCHTLKWNSHGFTCVPHPDPRSHLPLHPFPLGLPSAPGLSACLMHPTWAGNLFHPR